jgi:diguanylate cyclase (GGDEF)-like protein
VGNEPVAVLEIANSSDKRKLDEADAETLIIITNLASAAMENAQLFLWAISDPLTRLFNIHYFRRTLSSEMRRAERFRSSFSVVMLDLDNFKGVNDKYGHPMGDQVLVELAKILTDNLRKDVDVPSRYGGDEFILLLPNTNEAGAVVVINRILKVVRETRLMTEAGEEFGFAISVGIASFPAHGADEDRLIENADRALYKAKEGGKNCLAVFKP